MKQTKTIPLFLDFDMTLTEEYQQEPLFAAFTDALKKAHSKKGLRFENPKDYFLKCPDNNGIDYLQEMIFDAAEGQPLDGLTNEMLEEFGARIDPSPGIRDCLLELRSRFNGSAKIIPIIISVGLERMIHGFLRANNLDNLVYSVSASEFIPGSNGRIAGIKSAVIPFSKTSEIISYIKGSKELRDKYLHPGQYKFDYCNMIVGGDGFSDVPMWSYTKKQGGTPFAVYTKGDFNSFRRCMETTEVWVDYILPRDYTPKGITFKMLAEMVQRKLAQKCTFLSEDLYALRKGTLKHPDQLACVEQHLKRCEECASYYDKVIVTPSNTIQRIRTQHSTY